MSGQQQLREDFAAGVHLSKQIRVPVDAAVLDATVDALCRGRARHEHARGTSASAMAMFDMGLSVGLAWDDRLLAVLDHPRYPGEWDVARLAFVFELGVRAEQEQWFLRAYIPHRGVVNGVKIIDESVMDCRALSDRARHMLRGMDFVLA